jgi:Protein of unknown function (DUF3800)
LSRIYLFVDEAGNPDFSPKGSRYFILTSVAIDECSIEKDILELRRDLVWNGFDIQDEFHATEDAQAIRNEVFKLIGQHELRIDATIFEKAKAHPRRQTVASFYEFAWYMHMKHVAPLVTSGHEELLVTGASLSTRRKQALLTIALREVMERSLKRGVVRTACWPAGTDPCLQVADYCRWAIQRKWEKGDHRSHRLVEPMIQTEFDIFRFGKVMYY